MVKFLLLTKPPICHSTMKELLDPELSTLAMVVSKCKATKKSFAKAQDSGLFLLVASVPWNQVIIFSSNFKLHHFFE